MESVHTQQNKLHPFIIIPMRSEKEKEGSLSYWNEGKLRHLESLSILKSSPERPRCSASHPIYVISSISRWRRRESCWGVRETSTGDGPVLTCMILTKQISSLRWWISLGFGRRISCLIWHSTPPLPHSGWRCSVGSKVKVSLTNYMFAGTHLGYGLNASP
jgi:hypothetical protein